MSDRKSYIRAKRKKVVPVANAAIFFIILLRISIQERIYKAFSFINDSCYFQTLYGVAIVPERRNSPCRSEQFQLKAHFHEICGKMLSNCVALFRQKVCPAHEVLSLSQSRSMLQNPPNLLPNHHLRFLSRIQIISDNSLCGPCGRFRRSKPPSYEII